MSNAETIDELTDICSRLVDIVREQAFILEQLGAETYEDLELERRLESIRRKRNGF